MKKGIFVIAALAACLAACNNRNGTADAASGTKDTIVKAMNIVEEEASYPADTTTAISFIAYDKSKQGPRPVVLVIPEWWGLTEYPKMRARELAKLGYFAVAVDMYGQKRVGENPAEAGKLAGAFYADTSLVRSRISAAMGKALNYAEADSTKMAIIGYCFGGTMSLKAAKLGLPVSGVASFHGGLEGTASKNVPELICHGEADKMVSANEVTAWRKTMDSLGATYTFKSYPGATHAFTNPDATANGKKFNLPIEYNAAADTASWNELKLFLNKIF